MLYNCAFAGEVEPMSCLICAGRADTLLARPGWEERLCPDCGHYQISYDLVLTLMEQGQIFDIEKMRCWLESQRVAEAVPCVEIHEALLVP